MRLMKSTPLLLCILLVGLLMAPFAQGAAQELTPASQSPAPKDQKAGDTGYTQIILLAEELTQRANALEKEISGLFDKSAAETALGQLGKNLDGLFDRLEKMKTTGHYSPSQIMELKAAVLAEADSLKKLSEAGQKSAFQLETWNNDWQSDKKKWAERRSALPKDAPWTTLSPALKKGQEAIDAALKLIAQKLEPLLAMQQKASGLRTRMAKLSTDIDDLLLMARRDLFRKPGPSMFSSDYYSQLSEEHFPRADQDLGGVIGPTRQYFSKYGWVLFLQGLLSLFLVTRVRRHRTFFKGSERWRFISERPFAASIFAALNLGWLYKEPVPTALRFMLLAAIVLTIARLMGGLITDLWKKRLVYILAVLLIINEILQVFAFPLPLFRLYNFFVALGGILLFGGLAWKRPPTKGSLLFTWVLRLGLGVFGAAFFAELWGYNALAGDLIESSLKTTVSLLYAWVFMTLAQGALEWVLNSTRLQSISLLRSKADFILRRSLLIIRFFVGIFLVAVNLVIWGFYGTPALALQRVLALGVTIGSSHISLGLVLAAAAVLYGSLVASWAAQAALMEGLFTGREMHAGSRFSMARLIHYGFVLIGFLFALGALGVNLQNVTILAGALGVGIGFGLQTIVNNFVCGLVLLFERPIKVGDLIELGSQWAQIKKIGLRATIVETFDQAEVVVPNADLVTNKVTNWTLSSRVSRLTIPVGVAYGSDVALVLKILRECAEEHPLVIKTPPPMVLFMKFGESSLDFELRVYADVDHRLSIQSELHQAIDRQFREAGIEIPFPQRDLRIRDGGPLRST